MTVFRCNRELSLALSVFHSWSTFKFPRVDPPPTELWIPDLRPIKTSTSTASFFLLTTAMLTAADNKGVTDALICVTVAQIWAAAWSVSPAKTQISLGIPQTDQSSLCALWVAKIPLLLHADSKDWSAKSDLSLRWADRPCSWFCCAAGQMVPHGAAQWTI